MLHAFRVEHPQTGRGPFQSDHDISTLLARKVDAMPELPPPGRDGLGLGHLPWAFVFGCPSLETLKRWILVGDDAAENESIVRRLRRRGFVLAEYLVEQENLRMGYSRQQLAFDAADSKEDGLVEYHDLGILLS